MNVVSDPAHRRPGLPSVLDGSDPNCVPYNVFQIGGVTQEALDYLQAPGIQTGTIDQYVYQAIITGDLANIGLQEPDGVGRHPGRVRRRVPQGQAEEYDRRLAGNEQLSGTGGATIGIEGETAVTDLFMEVNVPLLQDVPFANSLGVDAAYRYSDYDTLSTDTYKFGMDWAPIEDVKFRASYQKAVRAANVVELFTAQGFNLFDLDGDPCGDDRGWRPGQGGVRMQRASRPACRRTCCARQRSTARPASTTSCRAAMPTLTPEESETVTFGIILQPRFLPKLSMSIDYFDIEITDTISTFGADNTLNACYFQGDAESCARINRDANGNLWRGDGFVEDLNVNIGSLQTSGIDLNLNYSGLEMGTFGSLNFNLTGTYLDELVTVPGRRALMPTTAPASSQVRAACPARNGVTTPAWAG